MTTRQHPISLKITHPHCLHSIPLSIAKTPSPNLLTPPLCSQSDSTPSLTHDSSLLPPYLFPIVDVFSLSPLKANRWLLPPSRKPTRLSHLFPSVLRLPFHLSSKLPIQPPLRRPSSTLAILIALLPDLAAEHSTDFPFCCCSLIIEAGTTSPPSASARVSRSHNQAGPIPLLVLLTLSCPYCHLFFDWPNRDWPPLLPLVLPWINGYYLSLSLYIEIISIYTIITPFIWILYYFWPHLCI
jgi:hypothetical protein